MGREHGIPLMQSISQLNYNSARPLSEMGLKAMQERGRMQEGMVTDKATYVQGALPSEGIPYVIVNGTVVVKDSEALKGVNPGQPIRFEPTESRMEPLAIETWTNTFYAVPHDFGGGVPGSQPHYEHTVPCCE